MIPLRSAIVPAVLAAGVVFSAVVLVRDRIEHLIGGGHRRAVTAEETERNVALVLEGESSAVFAAGHDRGRKSSDTAGTRHRSAILASAAALGIAAYIVPGAVFNYLRPGGYLSEIAWILTISMIAAVVAGAVGIVLGRWVIDPASPPASAHRLVRLGSTLRPEAPTSPRAHRRWGRRWHGMASIGLLIVAVVTSLWTLWVVLGSPHLAGWDARWSASIIALGPHTILEILERLGRTELAVVIASITALFTWRRAPRLAMAFPLVIAVTAIVNVGLKSVIDRPRPEQPSVATAFASYPSGHTLYATVVAVMVTAVIDERFGRRALTLAVAAVLTAAVVGTGLHRIVYAAHWPSDVIGGGLIGLLLASIAVLVAGRHDRAVAADYHLFSVPAALSRWAGRIARWWVPVAVVIYVTLAATIGIPTTARAGTGIEQLERGIQAGLLALAIISEILARRYEAVAATGLAIAGTGLAVLAAVSYEPTWAVAVSLSFLIPAFLHWLSWQRGQSLRALAVTATVAAILLAATWSAATAIWDHELERPVTTTDDAATSPPPEKGPRS